MGITDKILAYAAGAGCLVLAIALAATMLFYSGRVRSFEDAIDNPKTGYKVQLATASANALSLKGGLDQCNAGVAAHAGEQAATDKRLADAAAAMQPVLEKLQRSNAAIMAAKSGPDACKSANSLIMEQVR